MHVNSRVSTERNLNSQQGRENESNRPKAIHLVFHFDNSIKTCLNSFMRTLHDWSLSKAVGCGTRGILPIYILRNSSIIQLMRFMRFRP